MTVLFPIVAADDGRVERVVARLAARHVAFRARLERVGTFPAHVWLAPEPVARFAEPIAAVREAFPEFPPSGDPALEPVPHLTVGSAETEGGLRTVAPRAHEELGPRPPLAFQVEALTLLGEQPGGSWQEAARAPLRRR